MSIIDMIKERIKIHTEIKNTAESNETIKQISECIVSELEAIIREIENPISIEKKNEINKKGYLESNNTNEYYLLMLKYPNIPRDGLYIREGHDITIKIRVAETERYPKYINAKGLAIKDFLEWYISDIICETWENITGVGYWEILDLKLKTYNKKEITKLIQCSDCPHPDTIFDFEYCRNCNRFLEGKHWKDHIDRSKELWGVNKKEEE